MQVSSNQSLHPFKSTTFERILPKDDKTNLPPPTPVLNVWILDRWGGVPRERESGGRRWSTVPALLRWWCQVSAQTGDTGQLGASLLPGGFSGAAEQAGSGHLFKHPERNLKSVEILLAEPCVYFCLCTVLAGGKRSGVRSSAQVPGHCERFRRSRRSCGSHDRNHREGGFAFLILVFV